MAEGEGLGERRKSGQVLVKREKSKGRKKERARREKRRRGSKRVSDLVIRPLYHLGRLIIASLLVCTCHPALHSIRPLRSHTPLPLYPAPACNSPGSFHYPNIKQNCAFIADPFDAVPMASYKVIFLPLQCSTNLPMMSAVDRSTLTHRENGSPCLRCPEDRLDDDWLHMLGMPNFSAPPKRVSCGPISMPTLFHFLPYCTVVFTPL